MQRNGAAELVDACEQSERWTKSKIATFPLFRTCERPTECAVHCPEICPVGVDSVAYLEHVRAPPPSRRLLSMWPETRNLHEEKRPKNVLIESVCDENFVVR